MKKRDYEKSDWAIIDFLYKKDINLDYTNFNQSVEMLEQTNPKVFKELTEFLNDRNKFISDLDKASEKKINNPDKNYKIELVKSKGVFLKVKLVELK